MSIVLDSGGVSALARRDRAAAALIQALLRRGLWPPVVPSMVLVECLTGSVGRDANANRLLKSCEVRSVVSERAARRAAELRARAHCGSAVDAIIVSLAEPGGTVLTGDQADLEALAASAVRVAIELV